MYKLKLLLPLLLLCGIYIACNKDGQETLGPQAKVTFAGRVLDENGQAILGAQVRVEGENTSTDANGVFRLDPLRTDARNAILYVNKIGYFDFSRAYVVQDGSIQTVTIQLLKKQEVGAINANSGGTINVPGGAILNFPANALATKVGGAYSGTARVFARYLDPTDPQLPNRMPGDLRGINAADEEGVLSTFGMIGVEMEDQAGRPLQVAEGSTVEIHMPIPTEMAAVAPTEIDLWHYNTETARWEEEGSAQKVGNEYIGKVKHFSFWNCDSFSETVYMDGKVYVGNAQTPLSNARVRLTVLSNGFQGSAVTNANGWYGGAIPKGFALKLEVLTPDLCGTQVLYTEDIGPYSADVAFHDIVIAASSAQASVSGRLTDCTGAPVTAGYALLTVASTIMPLFAEADGTFSFTFQNCLSSANVNLVGYDLTNLLEGNQYSFSVSNGVTYLGDIPICHTLAEYIQYDLDGQPVVLVKPSLYISMDSAQNTQFLTQVYAGDSLSNGIGFSFASNNQPGTFAIVGLYVIPYEVDIANSNMITTVTEAPANPGNYLIGSFGSSFKDYNGISHTLTGNYRVLRE